MYISQINNNTFGNTKGMFLRRINNISENTVSKNNINQIGKNLNESKALKSNTKVARCLLQKMSKD